jgi:hypothetical protein
MLGGTLTHGAPCASGPAGLYLPIDTDYTYNLDHRYADFLNSKQLRRVRFDKVSQTVFKIQYYNFEK